MDPSEYRVEQVEVTRPIGFRFGLVGVGPTQERWLRYLASREDCTQDMW